MTNNSSTQSGNTRQIAPAIHWAFTLNNYTVDEIKELTDSDSSIVPRLGFKEEIAPTTGTPHLHGYCKFFEKKRPHSVFNNKRIHWDPVRKIKNLVAYIQKGDTRKPGGVLYLRGISPIYHIDIELFDWQKNLLSILDDPPDDRTIHWIWEPEGCAGKTNFAKWLFLNRERVIVLAGKAGDMKNRIIQYEMKNHNLPRIVIINIPRCQHKTLSYTDMEQIKDMFFYSGKYEGGMVCGAPPHVVVFANEEPDFTKLSSDRWQVQRV